MDFEGLLSEVHLDPQDFVPDLTEGISSIRASVLPRYDRAAEMEREIMSIRSSQKDRKGRVSANHTRQLREQARRHAQMAEVPVFVTNLCHFQTTSFECLCVCVRVGWRNSCQRLIAREGCSFCLKDTGR